MHNKDLFSSLNQQLSLEFYSSFLYLSMASYFTNEGLLGFANWMRFQAEEERVHAFKFFDYMLDRNAKVLISGINKPQDSWKSPIEAMEDALKHEKLVTSKIHELYELATSQKDYATQVFLQWFITEQVEEEASVLAIIEKMQFIENSKPGLMIIDRELSERK